MRERVGGPQSIVGAAAIVTTMVVLSAGTLAQTAAPAARPQTVPRTADGQPDLSGVWIATGAIRLLYGEEEVEAIRQADAAVGRPAPRREAPPYTPEAEATRQQYVARRGIDDPMARCLISGVPRITARPLPFQIVQTPEQIVILYEVHHAFRIIPTDGRPHPDDLEPSYLGDSVAHWEGDTLVVDVTGFNTRTWLTGVGTIHSEQLHVTERYTRDTFDTIRYEVTIVDPEVLTRPWRIEDTLRLRPNERIREYECIENNDEVLLRLERLLESGAVPARLP